MRPLHPITMPLDQLALIEASAGTGKTFTIALLYLRLLLGIDSKVYLAEQILVVTFTNAATEELRGRIRERIAECLEVFENSVELDSESGSDSDQKENNIDPLLLELKNKVDDLPIAIERLKAALMTMDLASIFTIHGFCNRLLQSFSFESGADFDIRFEVDDQQIRLQAAEDCWRHMVETFTLEQADIFSKAFTDPQGLLNAIKGFIGKPEIDILPIPEPDWDKSKNKLEEWQSFCLCWQSQGQTEIQSAIKFLDQEKKKALIKSLRSIKKYMDGYGQQPIPKIDKRHLVSLQGFLTKAPVPSMAIYELLQSLEQFYLFFVNDFSEFKQRAIGVWKLSAIDFVNERIQYLKQLQQTRSSDDLLVDVRRFIQSEDVSGMLQRVREQFPIALIDEFQDTDPVQFDIFDILYNQVNFPLLLIGDPKQAIYKFRGADVFTYLKAKSKAEKSESLYSMGVNYRSSPDLVSGINHIFSLHPKPFVLQQGIEFVHVAGVEKNRKRLFVSEKEWPSLELEWLQGTDFQKPKKSVTHSDGSDKADGAAPKLKPLSKTAAEKIVVESVAQKITNLIEAGRKGEAKIGDRAVEAGDIAVLVHSHYQSDGIQKALQQRGVGAVIKGQDSVFDSQEAIDILHLLLALNEPKNEIRLRTLLATHTMNLPIEKLDQIIQEERKWEEVLDQFSHYHQIWLRKGIQPAINQWMIDFDLAKTWLRDENISSKIEAGAEPEGNSINRNGRRVLTNLRHLAELLQQSSVKVEGQLGLINWYREQLEASQKGVGGKNSEGNQIRLETDDHLVNLVTIHASKGLEYNIVFVPFAWSAKEEKNAQFHRAGRSTVDFLNQPENLAIAQQETQAEALRLLYVALTRAKYHLNVTLVDSKDFIQSPLGYLLSYDTQSELPMFEQIQKAFSNVDSVDVSLLQDTEKTNLSSSLDVVSQKNEFKAKKMSERTYQSWRMSSFSALQRGSLHHHATEQSDDLPTDVKADPELFGEELSTDHRDNGENLWDSYGNSNEDSNGDSNGDSNQALVDEESVNIFYLKKGAHTGNFLHDLFEHWQFDCLDSETLSTYVAEKMSLEGGEEKWHPVLVKLLEDCLSADLSQGFFSSRLEGNFAMDRDTKGIENGNNKVAMESQPLVLNSLSSSQYFPELEFYFPVENLDLNEFTSLLHQYGYAKGHALEKNQLSGMLKGFIDLTFEWQGRYFILDYKSNHLGYNSQDYNQQSMAEAISHHLYDLQYLIYTLALHRFLTWRIDNYDYQSHIGGAIYMFLRGVEPTASANDDADNDGPNGIYRDIPPKSLIEAMDRLFKGEAQMERKKEVKGEDKGEVKGKIRGESQ